MKPLWIGVVLLGVASCAQACADGSDASTTDAGGATGADTGAGDEPRVITPEAGGCGLPDVDDDGDGFTEEQGDCDDCDPNRNPGAYDVPGNGLDENCSGTPDDEVEGCDGPIAIDTTDPAQLVRAIGLCKFVGNSDPSWGVLNAQVTQADRLSATDPRLHGVLPRFGHNNLPREGMQLLALSSGTARSRLDEGAVNPNGFGYHNADLEVLFPSGFPKNAAGCPGPLSDLANDSIALTLTIRVPTNAKSFAFDFNFFSPEYPQFVCSEYNDAFVVLLKGTHSGTPGQDGNISFDGHGNPISVNTGYFDVTEGPLLSGTWMQNVGGATGWLTTQAPVSPGEVIELSFMIWDATDHAYDSTVLVDAFRWSADPAEEPVTTRVR